MAVKREKGSWGRWGRLVVVLLSLSLAGCAYGKHLDRGDAFYARGNYEAALAEYRAAQALDPESEEAAARVAQAREQMTAQYRHNVEAALAAGDHAGAVVAAQEAYDTLPDSPGIAKIVDQASGAAQEEAAERVSTGDFAGGASLYELVLERLPTQRAAVEPKARKTREAWVADLTGRAHEASGAGRRGEALLLYAKAAQLSGDLALRGRRDELREAIREEFVYTVVPMGHGDRPSYEAVLAGLPRPTPRTTLRIERSATAKEAAAVVTLRVGRPEIEVYDSSRTEAATYVSGTRLVEEPAYFREQDELAREERELVDDENDVTRLQIELDRARLEVDREGPSPDETTWAERRRDSAEDRLEYARRDLMDQRRDVQRAREDLAHTPQFREVPVHSDHYFTVTTYEWRAHVAMAVTIEHTDGRPAIALEETLVASEVDETHDAQPVVGIPADPLQEPTRAEFEAQLYGEVSGVAARAIVESFEGWRASLLERARQAESENERVDLYGIYVATNPARVDSTVVAQLRALRGLPDPGATLQYE